MCKRTKCGLSVYIPCGKIGVFYIYVQESTEETSQSLDDFRDINIPNLFYLTVNVLIAHNILLYKCIVLGTKIFSIEK